MCAEKMGKKAPPESAGELPQDRADGHYRNKRTEIVKQKTNKVKSTARKCWRAPSESSRWTLEVIPSEMYVSTSGAKARL
jgi:hypothetical protein